MVSGERNGGEREMEEREREGGREREKWRREREREEGDRVLLQLMVRNGGMKERDVRATHQLVTNCRWTEIVYSWKMIHLRLFIGHCNASYVVAVEQVAKRVSPVRSFLCTWTTIIMLH